MNSLKQHHRPPWLAEFLLKRILPDEGWNTPLGDFEEDYNEIAAGNGIIFAWFWYFGQIFNLIPGKIYNSFSWSIAMFFNYIKTSLRNIKKQKGYTFINITGLAVGMTCFILIMLYVKYELSFDTFHKNSDRIYRVALNMPTWNLMGSTKFAVGSGALAPALKQEFEEVEFATRLSGISTTLGYDNNNLKEDGIYADENFFNVFSFSLKTGYKTTALKEPFSIVLSEKLAQKLFGDKNPIGEVINSNNKNDLKVTGIIKNAPENSHIYFDYIISLNSIDKRYLGKWESINYCSYVLLKEGVAYKDFENKLPSIVEKYRNYDSEETKQSYFLQPLTDIHLHSHLNAELSDNSDIKNIYIFSSIGILVLLIACINYINYATARSAKRFKEIGIRKTIGAQRTQLIRQFLGESFIVTFLALLITAVLVGMILPSFKSFVERDIELNLLSSWSSILSLSGIFIFVGIVSGLYPALLLSSYKPVSAFKNRLMSSSLKNPFKLRNLLILFQFSITAVLILFTLVIQKQLHYIKYKDTGYSRENIVVIRNWDKNLNKKPQAVKNDLLKIPNITGVTVSSRTPFRISNVSSADIESENPGKMVKIEQISCNNIDYDFINLYDIKLIAGRNFSSEYSTDKETAVIINERAVKEAGLLNPIGKKFSRWNIKNGRIIGVVKDFHFMSFKLNIAPVMFLLRNEDSNKYSIKYSTANINKTLKDINTTFRKHSNNFVFDYSFIDDSFNNLYKAEQKFGTILVTFSIIAIIIASLGLIGLASYIAELSTKEISIRKTLGATVSSILILLSKDFFILVLVSNLIAWPVGYFLIKNWLQEFVYRTEINPGIFLLSGFLVLLFTIVMVSYQSIKAARANPVDSLKYE